MPSERSLDIVNLKACLRAEYGIDFSSIEPVVGGYDFRASSCRAIAADGAQYFVKVRDDKFRDASLVVPRRLVDAGAANLLAPYPTLTGSLSCIFEDFTVAVFPYVSALIAKERQMSLQQWRELGKTMSAIHTFDFDISDVMKIRVDDFDSDTLASIRDLSRRMNNHEWTTSSAARFVEFWHEYARELENLVETCEELEDDLRERKLQKVVCHSDCHLWNVLVGDDGDIYLTDWDDGPVIAPKERDLFLLISPDVHIEVPEEEIAFLEGYGTSNVDLDAMCYYRIERKLEDVVVSGNDILFNTQMSEETKMRIAEDLPRFLE